jgi:hypothetical protein
VLLRPSGADELRVFARSPSGAIAAR